MDVISTAEVPAEDRLAFWHEESSKRWVPSDAHSESRRAFRAHGALSRLGPVRVVRLTMTPVSIHRTARMIRLFDPEAVLVTCGIRGRVLVEQDDRCAELCPGDLALRVSSRPYVTSLMPESATAQWLAMQFSRSLLPLPDQALRDLTAVRLPGDREVGALASRFLLELGRRMGELTPSDATRLSTLTLDLLTTALAHELDRAAPSRTDQRALLARIRAFIQRNLSDPGLTPATIAAAHHISLSYLHKLFQQEEHTVAGLIRHRRLENCRRDLADPRLATHPINAIAARWGFTSPAHFSHAFRGAYGVPPRDFRQEQPTVHAD